MSKFCCDCINWEKNIIYRSGTHLGICHDVGVAMNVAMDSGTKLGEDGTLYTAGLFGCIYWKDRGNEVINFDDIIDSETGEII